MMHTELYCDKLADVDPVKAIRAVHQAYLQLNATKDVALTESYDNKPSIAALSSILKTAGHPGFQDFQG
jgi:S-methylmethionine-dependent homocysteine/selenocysteine methylase